MAMKDNVEFQFSGLVLGTRDPERLSAWYRAAFAPEQEPGDVIGRPLIEVGGTRLIFDQRTDVKAEAAEPGRILINLRVPDARAAEAHLRTLDVVWVRKLEALGPVLIGTFEDPDGNYVQIIENPSLPADAS